ncbi:MAG: NAD-dependent epimerase/dehydratase family protein [Planctomycetota bacterium]
MQVLVTGATGFWAGAVARRMQGLGSSRGARAAIQMRVRRCRRRACFARLDLVHEGAAERALEGCDAVVHCAALSSPLGLARDSGMNNVYATHRPLAAAQTAGVRRFCAHLDAGVSGGRGQSFGSARGRALPRRLANHYVRSKLEAEGLVQQASGRVVCPP